MATLQYNRDASYDEIHEVAILTGITTNFPRTCAHWLLKIDIMFFSDANVQTLPPINTEHVLKQNVN